MTSQQVIKLLEMYSNQINSRIIKDLIEDHLPTKQKMEKLYKSYSGNVAIKERKFEDVNKINNQLANDYRGDIVDGITGYMFGERIGYSVDKTKYSEALYNLISERLSKFFIQNNIEDLDSTTGEMMSICGMTARLLYIDKNGLERIMPINPWEVIFVMNQSIDEVQYALIYYDVEIIENGEKKKRVRVEWYDSKNVTFFVSNENGDYDLDLDEKKNPMPHMFDGIPVVRFINNNLQQGDFEKVETLIDAYDRTLSDIQNEVEEFRLAYFAFYGVEPTPEIMKAARQSGAFGFPEGTNGNFLVKDLSTAVEFMKEHKKTINENIYKFAKAVDMRDEQFSGSAMSGESRRWKLINFENRAKAKERKFVKALRDQFRILCSAWNTKEIKLNYEDVTFQFKRNLPVDLQYIAGVLSMLNGQISDETRLGLAPFIDSVDKEIERMKFESDNKVDFNSISDAQQLN
ncbi:MAG: phage portal protein [Melioribacter sp.]|nr:phage portal protein [Melioribacter sp.]